MFDWTSEVKLDKKQQRVYETAQVAIYVAAFFFGLLVILLVLFPTQYFTFSFLTPDSSGNTINNPRNDAGEFTDKGRISAAQPLRFDTPLIGNYSKAVVSFNLNKKADDPGVGQVEIRKSYQAFLYPTGDPIGFRDGSLVKQNSNYYIVSGGKLRKFEKDSLEQLKFPKDAFISVNADDLRYSLPGNAISPGQDYPENSLFFVDGDYYELISSVLRKFVSPTAFATQFDASQAIPMGTDFLKKYEINDELIGFADGALISYGEGAYVVSDGKILPIDSPITYEAMGYSWGDLIQASGDEYSLYKKTKIRTIADPHPDGTIFESDDNGGQNWYLIQDGKKIPLPTETIARSWMKISPIVVSLQSLDISNFCNLQKSKIFPRTFSCEIPIEKIAILGGKDFEFKAEFAKDIKIDAINVKFTKDINIVNLKHSLGFLLGEIKKNYAQK